MYQEWLKMEQFYYWHFAVMLIIGLIAFLLVISTVSHIKVSKTAKRILQTSCIVLLLVGAYSAYGFTKYGDLINKTGGLNAAVRQYKRTFFMMDFPYSATEMSAYSIALIPQVFEKTDLYIAKEKSQDIEYLGKNPQGVYYFKIQDRIYSAGKRWIEFTDKVDQPRRVGKVYYLNDNQFQKIGFNEKSRVMLEKYQIPIQLKNKTSDREIEDQVFENKTTMIQGWISK